MAAFDDIYTIKWGVKENELRVGDHIIADYKVFNHDGIVVDVNPVRIVDLTNSKGGIHFSTFKEFVTGKMNRKIGVAQYKIETFSIEDTVEYAKLRAPEPNCYNALNNNCQQFATLCKCGYSFSKSKNEIGKALGGTAVAGLTAGHLARHVATCFIPGGLAVKIGLGVLGVLFAMSDSKGDERMDIKAEIKRLKKEKSATGRRINNSRTHVYVAPNGKPKYKTVEEAREAMAREYRNSRRFAEHTIVNGSTIRVA